jgi:phosphoglycolate phosphatase
MVFDAGVIEGLLFDLDGTLIDSTADLAAAGNWLRVSQGMEPLSEAHVASYVGDGVESLVRRLLERDDVASQIEPFKDHYNQHCLDTTYLYAGVAETLKALKERGYKMAVVTNKPERISRHILEGLGVAGCFSSVIGGNTCTNKKPHPEPLLKACFELGLKPEHGAMVGDSRVDVEAAHNTGMPCLALYGGIGDQALLKAAAPEIFLKDFSELTHYFPGKP